MVRGKAKITIVGLEYNWGDIYICITPVCTYNSYIYLLIRSRENNIPAPMGIFHNEEVLRK